MIPKFDGHPVPPKPVDQLVAGPAGSRRAVDL